MQAAADSIEDYLRKVHDFMNNGQTFYGFTLEHGQQWTPQALPGEFDRWEPKACFANSQELLVQEDFLTPDSGLTYVEGYAVSGELIEMGTWIPLHHGWLVDREGRVIDVTWTKPEGSIYFGVPFNTRYVKRVIKETKLFTSLIDNMAQHWPLITGEHPAEEAVKRQEETANDGR
jgi:hypothetical protein